MLKVFRDNLKYLSWVLWLVIAVFVLFVFVDFGGTVPGPAPPSEAAAVVAGDEISYGELQRAYRQAEEAYRQAYGAQFTPELARQLQLPLQVLEQLVRQRILLDEADRMELRVSDAELQASVLEIPYFQNEQGAFVGPKRYVEMVRRLGYASAEEFEEGLRSDLLLAKLNRVLADNILVSDADVEAAYRERAERVKISYFRVPLADFRGDETLPAEEVEAYFEEHIEDFRLPERRAVDYLLIDPDVIRQGLSVSDEELLTYYTANSADYEAEERVRARQILLLARDRSEEEAMAQLEEIRARVEAGEEFAALASEFSEDTFTASQGGEMAPFGRGQILPEVEEAAFDAEVGSIVGPIKSSSAYHLLQILEHTSGGLPPFEEMKEAVRRRLLAERAREAAEAKASDLATRVAREEIASAEAFEKLAAEDPAVSFRSTQPFGRSDNVPGIGRSTPFSAAAFALDATTASEPVRVGAGWAILRLAATEEPRLPELAEVGSEVRSRLRDLAAQQEALSRLATARDEILGGREMESVAATYEASVEQSQEFDRNGRIGGSLGTDADLAAAALESDEGDLGGPLIVGTHAVLFRVDERQRFDPAAFAEAADATRDEIAAQRLDDLLETVIGERRNEMEITYDPRISENLGLTG